MKIKLPLLSIIISTIFLSAKCKKDNGDENPNYVKGNVNGVAWQSKSVTVTTILSASGIDPEEITGIFNDTRIGIKITNPAPGTYPFRINPVTFLTFTGEKFESSHRIKWTTVSEVNISNYSVEYSADGSNWASVATLNPTGGGNYESILNGNPVLGGSSYYRLKVNNTDGSFQYSSVVVISGSYRTYYKPSGEIARNGYSGNIEINTLDRANRLIIGHFYFKIKTTTGQLYEITNGEFQVNY